MQTCMECGEDLKLDSNDFLVCENEDCKKSKPDTFDQIGRIEQQNLINEMMDNTQEKEIMTAFNIRPRQVRGKKVLDLSILAQMDSLSI